MGSWGYGNFENDGAADFIIQVEEEGITKIYQSILFVTELPESEFLEADECQQALAAIEYIAAAKGNPSATFPAEARKWLKEKYHADILDADPSDPHKAHFDLTEISLNAIERIKTNSELQELWEEGGQASEWNQELEDLKKRVS